MYKVRKRMAAFLLIGVICCGSIGMNAFAASSTFKSSKAGHTWTVSASSSIIGAAAWQLRSETKNAAQYKYDKITLETCLYVNGPNNAFNTKSTTNWYTLSSSVTQGGTSSSTGKGYAKATLSDSLYGSGSGIVYN